MQRLGPKMSEILKFCLHSPIGEQRSRRHLQGQKLPSNRFAKKEKGKPLTKKSRSKIVTKKLKRFNLFDP